MTFPVVVQINNGEDVKILILNTFMLKTLLPLFHTRKLKCAIISKRGGHKG